MSDSKTTELCVTQPSLTSNLFERRPSTITAVDVLCVLNLKDWVIGTARAEVATAVGADETQLTVSHEFVNPELLHGNLQLLTVDVVVSYNIRHVEPGAPQEVFVLVSSGCMQLYSARISFKL